MAREVFSYILLIAGIVIGLGAFGHGYSVGKVHAAIDQFPIDTGIRETLYIVWYFVSGSMLVFGATIVWTWFRLRAGDTSLLFAVCAIGALYVAMGIGGMIYRRGDLFGVFFVVLGVLLLASCFALKSGRAPEARQPGQRAGGSSSCAD